MIITHDDCCCWSSIPLFLESTYSSYSAACKEVATNNNNKKLQRPILGNIKIMNKYIENILCTEVFLMVRLERDRGHSWGVVVFWAE